MTLLSVFIAWSVVWTASQSGTRGTLCVLVVGIVVCSVQLMRSFEGLYLPSWKELPGDSVAVQGEDLCSSLVFLDSTDCSVCSPVCLREIRTAGLSLCLFFENFSYSSAEYCGPFVRENNFRDAVSCRDVFIQLMASVAGGQLSLTISMNCD